MDKASALRELAFLLYFYLLYPLLFQTFNLLQNSNSPQKSLSSMLGIFSNKSLLLYSSLSSLSLSLSCWHSFLLVFKYLAVVIGNDLFLILLSFTHSFIHWSFIEYLLHVPNGGLDAGDAMASKSGSPILFCLLSVILNLLLFFCLTFPTPYLPNSF